VFVTYYNLAMALEFTQLAQISLSCRAFLCVFFVYSVWLEVFFHIVYDSGVLGHMKEFQVIHCTT
jgi:hypothetical protein